MNLEELAKLTLAQKRQVLEEKILIAAKKDEFDVIVVLMDISGSVTDNNNFAFEAQIDEIVRLLEGYFVKVKILFCGWGDSQRFTTFDQSFIDRRIVENYFLRRGGSFDDQSVFHGYTMPSSPIKEGHALLKQKGYTPESRILFIVTTDGNTNSRIDNRLEHRVTEDAMCELKRAFPLLSIWFVFADMKYKAENAEQMAGDTMLTMARRVNTSLPVNSLPLVTRMCIKTTRKEPGIEELRTISNKLQEGHYSFGLQSFKTKDIQLFFALQVDLIHGETQIDTNDHLDLLFKLNDTFREISGHFPLDVLLEYQTQLIKAFEGTETGSDLARAYFSDMNERISEKKIYLKRESIAFCQQFFQSCNEKLSIDAASAVGLSATKGYFLSFPLDPVVLCYGACEANEFCDFESDFPVHIRYRNLAIKAGFNTFEQKPIILPVLPCVASLQDMDPVQEQCLRQAFRAVATDWLYARYGYTADFKSDEMIIIALFLNALIRLSSAPDNIKLGWRNMALIMLRKRVFCGNSVSTVLRDLLSGKPFLSSEQQSKFVHYMNIVKKLAEVASTHSTEVMWCQLVEALEMPELMTAQKSFIEIHSGRPIFLRMWGKECNSSQPLQMGTQRASFSLPIWINSKPVVETSITTYRSPSTANGLNKIEQKAESQHNTSLRGCGQERRIVVFLRNGSLELQTLFIESIALEFSEFFPTVIKMNPDGDIDFTIMRQLPGCRIFVVPFNTGVNASRFQGIKNTFLFSVYYNNQSDFEIIKKQINWYLHNRTTYRVLNQ